MVDHGRPRRIPFMGMRLSQIVAIALACGAILALAATNMDLSHLASMKTAIPSDLAPAFEKSPVAVLRLLSNWEYVNQLSGKLWIIVLAGMLASYLLGRVIFKKKVDDK